MKSTIIILTSIVLLSHSAFAQSCWSTSLGYPCCKTNCDVVVTDGDGDWGVENDEWCGISNSCGKSSASEDACWSLALGYPCCEPGTTAIYTDDSGDWGVLNDDWCGIQEEELPIVTKTKTTTTPKSKDSTTKTKDNKPGPSTADTGGKFLIPTTAGQAVPTYEPIECTPPDIFSYGQCCHGPDLKAYAQCGGIGYEGPNCCQAGTVCTEINEHYSHCEPNLKAPIRPVMDIDKGIHGGPWCKPPNCVVTANYTGFRWGYDPVLDKGCEIPEYECYELMNKTWGPQLYPVGTEEGVTTRYYDCCKPSCSWPGKADVFHPVRHCKVDGTTLIEDQEAPSACQKDVVGTAHMCENQQPWAVSDSLSYGFAAAALPGGESVSCCKCYALTFTDPPIRGKQLVVQVTNTGSDVGSNQFDLQIPGGGVGIFDACTNMYGLPAGSNGWGKQYGGITGIEDCESFPESLKEGCKWRFNWLLGADNPKMKFAEVECPKVLTDITGCIRKDAKQSD
jgi:hypothetical protein